MHPILFSVGNFFIGTYGVMIALGLLAGIFLAAWRGEKRGLSKDLFLDLAVASVASGFLGARIFFILLNPKEFARDPMGLIFSRTGFVFLGGFVFGVGCVYWFLRRKKLPPLVIGDLIAPSIALTHGLGRIGCHLAGCCWGGLCKIPALGIHLKLHEMPNGLPFANAYTDQLDRGLIETGAATSLAVWPVQLMEAGGLFVLAAFLVWFHDRKPRRPGLTLGLYVGLYAVLRFTLEFLRGDADRGMFFGGTLSTSQLISLAMVPAAVFLIWRSRKLKFSPYSHPSLVPAATPADTKEAASMEARVRKRRQRRGA